MAEEATIETFRPAVGDGFTVGGEAGATVELLLVEAEAKDAGPGAPKPAFSLVFHGPAEPALAQGTYPFEHPGIGAMDIFIVPLGRDEHGSVYEALFA
jgi:hypothetical protein